MSYNELANKFIEAAGDPKKFRRIIVGCVVLTLCAIIVFATWHHYFPQKEQQHTVFQQGNQNQGAGKNDGTMHQENK